MRCSIGFKQLTSRIGERVVIGFVETPGADEKATLLHINMYRAAPKKTNGLSKTLWELAINKVFEGRCIELKHPTLSELFFAYNVNLGNKIINPKTVSEMTMELRNEIKRLINEKLAEEPNTGAFRF